MLRTALLALILIVSLSSSSSSLRKSIARRQTDSQYCQAIEGFDCKCSYYRVTCTADRELPSPINVVPNERNKYQSVELVITAARDIHVDDQTFAPIKDLFKTDADNYEFRVKFEKFTGLHLSSPSIFNRAYPDNAPANARKTFALEIYNPDVPPNDNPYLFKNLNADAVELYALYPFKGSFQQLFDGANIKYLRLSGGEIRSDASQPFTGNIGRLELAKQASELSVQNFPVYPAHELTINAFYVDDFNSQHPPNYNNLGELRVHSNGRIPANAFQNFPNIHTLQVTTEQDIDPQAFNGLNNLEKLVIKDAKFPIENLKNLPNLKEYETNFEKLDEKTQCQLLEKLANGQLAVQAIPNGRECTCAAAYLDSAIGRTPCDAEHCDHSTCAAIKNNYNAQTRTFNTPPAIRRADGSDALRPRDQRVYNSPAQISNQDQQKLQSGLPQQPQQPSPQEPSGTYDGNQGQGQQYPSDTHDSYWGQNHGEYNPYSNQNDRDNDHSSHNNHDNQYHDQQQQNHDDHRYDHDQQQQQQGHDDHRYDHDQQQQNHDDHRYDQQQQGHDDHHTEPPSRNDHDDDSHRHDHGQYTETPSQYNEDSHRDNDAHDWNRNDDVYSTKIPDRYDEDSHRNNDDTSFSEDHQHEHNYPSSNNNNNNEENLNNDDDNAPLTTTGSDWNDNRDLTTIPYSSFNGQQDGGQDQNGDGTSGTEGGDNQGTGEGNENRPDGNENQPDGSEGQGSVDEGAIEGGSAVNGTDTSAPQKKGMSWLPIIIIAAAIVALLLIGLLVLFLRKKRNPAGKGEYRQASGNEQTAR